MESLNQHNIIYQLYFSLKKKFLESLSSEILLKIKDSGSGIHPNINPGVLWGWEQDTWAASSICAVCSFPW